MQTFSAIQRRLLDARDDQVKMCIEIDDTTPIRKCTGADPIEVDSDWYDPGLGPKSFDKIALTDPRTSRTTINFPDHEGTIRAQWYSSKLDCGAVVYWLLRDQDGSWNTVLTIAWSVEECSYNANSFTVSLSAAAGSRPRAGGAIGTRSEFPYAPEPGEALRLGTSGGITFRSGVGVPPPAPGGQQDPFSRSDLTGNRDSGPQIPGHTGSNSSGNLAIPAGGGNSAATS